MTPMTTEKLPQAKQQHEDAIKKFDYTSIFNTVRMASLNNYNHPTGVVNLVCRPNVPTFSNLI